MPIPDRLRGTADAKVLAHAARSRRILVTLDALAKDAGASSSEKKLAAERARRVRSELGE